MFLIGLGFTPRMTCCNPDLGAIVNLIIASRSRHTNSLQEMKLKKRLLRGYDIPKLLITVFFRKKKSQSKPNIRLTIEVFGKTVSY